MISHVLATVIDRAHERQGGQSYGWFILLAEDARSVSRTSTIPKPEELPINPG